jgi:hypothetical protein
MLDYGTLLMVLVLMFVLVIMLLIMISDRVTWWIKIAPIVLIAVAAWFFYSSVISRLGYPVALNPEGSFRVVGVKVREPSPGDAGVIWLWATMRGESQPRAIAMPYSKKNHEKAEEARKKLGTGRPVDGQFKEGKYTEGLQADPDLDLIPPPDTMPEKGK